MDIVIGGQMFSITAWKHPSGASRQFPKGIFYAQIDGYSCSASESSAEQALSAGVHNLRNGQYEASIRDSLQCYQGWLNGHATTPQYLEEARAAIPTLGVRLEKLRASGLLKSWRCVQYVEGDVFST